MALAGMRSRPHRHRRFQKLVVVWICLPSTTLEQYVCGAYSLGLSLLKLVCYCGESKNPGDDAIDAFRLGRSGVCAAVKGDATIPGDATGATPGAGVTATTPEGELIGIPDCIGNDAAAGVDAATPPNGASAIRFLLTAAFERCAFC